MTIAVVLFDLDDTLFAHSTAVAHGVLAHRTALGLPGDDAEELDRWTALEEHHYHRYLRGELGIITNAELAFQQGKIDAMGIAGHFEHVIASGEVGHAKPDSRIFLAAVQRFGVDAPHAAYVGDRLHTDAIGAARAGLVGIWLDRNGQASAEDSAEAAAAGVHVIHSLAEIPGVVREHDR